MVAKDWKPVRKLSRTLGPVWVVTRSTSNSREKGFFKIPPQNPRYHVKHSLANELIASRLAKLLGLNAAEVELAEVNGRLGVVSVVQPAPGHYNWNQLGRRVNGSIFKHLTNPEQILQTFVFDIWICNVDRHGGNIVTIPRGKKYSFYLIDHGIALLGAVSFRGVPWQSSYWNHVNRYNRHYIKGMKSRIHSYQQLEPFVEEIQDIPVWRIYQVVDGISDAILASSKKEIVKKMLVTRQQNLHTIVKNWCKAFHKDNIAASKSDKADKGNKSEKHGNRDAAGAIWKIRKPENEKEPWKIAKPEKADDMQKSRKSETSLGIWRISKPEKASETLRISGLKKAGKIAKIKKPKTGGTRPDKKQTVPTVSPSNNQTDFEYYYYA